MEKYEIDDLKSNLKSYLESSGIDTSNFFRCINPQHTDTHPSMKYFDDHRVFCFGCKSSYDLFDVISIMEGIDEKEAFKRAMQTYKFNLPANKAKIPLKQEKNTKDKTELKDYEKAFYVWQLNFNKSNDAKQYLKQRGIDEKTAKRFKLGFNHFNFGEFEFNALIIPVSKNCFTARNISADCDKIRYYKPKGCQTELFNIAALKTEKPYCVITEGEFDCLSFETLGINAMALCSVNNSNKFIELNKPLDKKYILALDNDEAGQKTTAELISYFEKNNISYIVFDNCGYKDANQALVEDSENFKTKINEIVNEIILLDKRKQKQSAAEM